jgi:hypothetical protein
MTGSFFIASAFAHFVAKRAHDGRPGEDFHTCIRWPLPKAASAELVMQSTFKSCVAHVPHPLPAGRSCRQAKKIDRTPDCKISSAVAS